MDAVRFDALTKACIAATSRRRTLAALLVGALGAVGVADADDTRAAKSGRCKKPCGDCAVCEAGMCRKTTRGKKRCKRGRCAPKENGTACAGPGFCWNGECTPT